MFSELTTERLLLQTVQPEDQHFIFAGLSHPEVIPFYGVSFASYEATKMQMEWYREHHEEGTGQHWKIIEKASGENIGVIQFYEYKPEHHKAEVGFWALPHYWNKGIISEALRCVIDYCRKEKGIHRLEATVEVGNGSSSRVLEKAGFHYEGTMRECEMKNGKYISLLMYGLLLDDDVSST